jgi:cytochrome c6
MKSILLYFLIVTISFQMENINENEYGEELFNNNCSVCHLGGNNIIIPEKNLKFETLEANGMNTTSAIKYQIINGKNGMPAFGGRLKEIEIEQIAKYVLDNAKTKF